MIDENTNDKKYCDIETGICPVSSFKELSAAGSHEENNKVEIIYVGDPMCSWCYGISSALIQLRDHFLQTKIPFKIVVGGLRPGGGGKWDINMKEMLKHHWEQVRQKSSRPFGYKLFELESFNYDTEPPCRAVVAARPLIGAAEMEFFEAIQRKFYVESENPASLDFYKSICDEFKINYSEFKTRFENEEVKDETFMEFDLNRKWGVQAFPAVILSKNNKRHFITHGYSSFEKMKNMIEKLMGPKPQSSI
ncbi:MAG: DsbA family protein [Spirochaetia bacterium]|nr:DsbA family protein [Spirochaetia bacterium]